MTARRRASPAWTRRTCCDSFAFFRAIFDEIAADYPNIDAERIYTDASAQALVMDPGHFDVIVTETSSGIS